MGAKFDDRRPKVEVHVFSRTTHNLVRCFAYMDHAARYIARAPERYLVSYFNPLTGLTKNVTGGAFLRQAGNFPRSRNDLRARRKIGVPAEEALYG
jgi:hypothetical protein